MNLQLKRHWSLMMLLVAIPAFVFSQTVADGFTVSWSLDPNTSDDIVDRDGYGGENVMTGLDLDGDGLREILFTLDETLAPGGPDPGHIDVYLYETDGNDSYAYVWGFQSPELSNSLPGLGVGDIDEDGLNEIYFGIPPASGSNDNTWGTYIFEQDAQGVFPTTPTLVYTHGYAVADNFRPAGFQLEDIDNDGDIELLAIDRGARRLQILSLATEGFDDFADFTLEYELGDTTLGGGGVYDLMVVDFDDDGLNEVWVNTWDMFSMAIVEVTDTNEYALQVDLNQLYADNDPGSFNKHDMFFKDIDGDGALEAWLPMTDGMLYYIDDVDSSVTEIDADAVIQVGMIGTGNSRGASIGDLNGDGDEDIVISCGTDEYVNMVEYNGIGDPTDINSYVITEIYNTIGGDADRYYPNSISPVDMDGDGFKEVAVCNIKATEVGQNSLVILEYNPYTDSPVAANWTNVANILHSDSEDTSFVKDFSGNSRTGIAGMDMDQDGIDEVILTDYVKKRVMVFEYDATGNAFDMVWASPDVDSVNSYGTSNPRTVSVGDLDSDGKQEIVFPSSNKALPGWYIYEWDGVTGSDNYGTTYSSLCLVELDTCCPGAFSAFRGDHERSTIFDIDSDGQEELISMIRRNSGGDRGTIIMSVDGDIEHNAGGTGLETWGSEFFLERGDYGGGSPYHSQPADLDGDGTYELVNTTWNYMNFYNIDATGADSYAAAPLTSDTRYYQATYPSDHVSLFGGAAGDVDGNGDDEAFFPNYYTADLYVVDYESGDDVLAVSGDHIVKVVEGLGKFGISLFDIDGNSKDDIFVGTAYPQTISRTQLVGTDPRNPADYQTEIIYTGEQDLLRDIKVVTDENGATTTTFSHTGVFASKVQSHFQGTGLDFDGDTNFELFASFQSNVDSITTTTITWNTTNSDYDTVETKVLNERSWVGMLFEFAESGVGVEELTFVTPEDYKLLPNYPNPFNPVTNIDFILPLDKKVSLKIYNVRGQLVRTLIGNEFRTAGEHHVQWNGLNDAGMKVASGAYIYSLEWGNFRTTKMMTLLK